MRASAGLRLAAAAAIALVAVVAVVAAPFLLATVSDAPSAAVAGAIELALAGLAGWLAGRGSTYRALLVMVGVLALGAAAVGLVIWGLETESNWI